MNGRPQMILGNILAQHHVSSCLQRGHKPIPLQIADCQDSHATASANQSDQIQARHPLLLHTHHIEREIKRLG